MQRLGELVLGFLNKELQPSCQLACLETIRILSRDKHCVNPFITRSAMATLARYAGITVVHTDTPTPSQPEDGQGIGTSEGILGITVSRFVTEGD